MVVPPPHAVSWNLTRRCNLQCDHCYLDAAGRAGAGDLPTAECLRIVEQLAEVNSSQLLIVTGGEPLLRPDLTQITRAAADAGMTVVLGTNGTLLDADKAAELARAGVQGVGISIDSAPGGGHDDLRGSAGCREAAMRGIDACKAAGLEFLIQTSVFRWNRDELSQIAAIAAERGARAWNVYFLVCTGRGQQLTDLSPAEYEAALHEVRAIQREYTGRLLVAVRCAPQYRRVVAEEPDPGSAFHAYPSGCPAAIHYVRIGTRGEVTPCPYMPNEVGRLDQQSFAEVWQSSPELAQLRDRTGLQGRCGPCSYRDTCGGCRARALAVFGDPMAEDPSCDWDPATARDPAPVPEPTFALPDQCTMSWAPQAVERLDRVPSFLHGLVVKRVEAEARKRGVDVVTPEIMKDVRARSKDAGPPAMFAGFGGATHAGEDDAAVAPRSDKPLVWMPEALGRLEDAPEFVRPGIRKLMALRARQHGRTVIDSEFLTEIRDESMMRVSRVIRRFGLDKLDPSAFDEARRRMAKKGNKLLVIDQIEEFLRKKGTKNEVIRDKFRKYLADAGGKGRPWMPDATERVDGLPEMARSEAREAIELEAKRIKAPVVTQGVVERVLGPQKERG